MNIEMAKIRRTRNYDEIINGEPTRIKTNRLCEMAYELNCNYKGLISSISNNDIKIDDFVNIFTINTYIVLSMFNEMGVYPDYFYDQIVKMNIDYKKIAHKDNGIRGNYHLFKETNLANRVSEDIDRGLKNGYYRLQAYKNKDINDAFLEMLGFFQTFNIPYNICTKEQCKKVFKDIQFNQTFILESLLNSDYLSDDIECLSRLLFEYISFFVSMGIYPKEHLDKYIESFEKGKHK